MKLLNKQLMINMKVGKKKNGGDSHSSVCSRGPIHSPSGRSMLYTHMQELKLMLITAQWMAKQLSGGFSVSFFWPASTAGNLPNHSVVLKRRKRVITALEGTTLAAQPCISS